MRSERDKEGGTPIMHRWHFQRLVRWLIPILLYGMALCGLVLEQKGTVGSIGFAEDEAYRDLAMARTLATAQHYALQPGGRAVAWRNALWRLLLAGAGFVAGTLPGALYVLAAISGCLIILLLSRVARLLFPFPPFVLYTAVLLVLGPGLLRAVTSGTATPFVGALVLWAVLAHIEGLQEGKTPLGCWVIVALGLASWLRIELLVLWPVLAAHAWLMALTSRNRKGICSFVALRALTGIFVLSLFVAPLVAWNLRVVHVPWPQIPGSPMTANTLVENSPSQVWTAYRALALQGVREAFGIFHLTCWMRGTFERFLTWTGAVFTAVLAWFGKEERPFSVIFWGMLVTPVLLGLLYPIVGTSAAIVVAESLSPLGILAAAFVIFRAPFVVEAVYRRFKEGLPSPVGFQVWWASAGGLLAFLALLHSVSLFRSEREVLAAMRAAREDVALAISENAGAVATDQPGWLAWTQKLPVIDLSGESTPELLACLDAQGQWDLDALTDSLLEMGARHVFLWEPLAQAVPSEWKKMSHADRPDEPLAGTKRPQKYEITSGDVL